jgi:DNA-binding response OmpR family regulator
MSVVQRHYLEGEGMPKILIVEDDKTIALALTVRLKAKGHEVFVAQDAFAGLSLASTKKPDMVLLDIGMPAGGGFGLAEKMQNLAATVGIPFIFLTASKDPQYRKRAEALGAAAYVEKPYDADELLATIDRVLATPT